ncbi:MAG: magnesium chelatase domain-containing protein, partial [Gemmatimonadaceae bacterium]
MLAAIRSGAVLGVEAAPVTVEVDAAPGLPGWTMVGLPSGSVKEARDRVGAALVNAGFMLPPRRWTINLSPADLRKEGTAFDLPIAIAVLVASGQLAATAVDGIWFAGELGLDGSVRPIRGALPLARAAGATGARARGPAAIDAQGEGTTTNRRSRELVNRYVEACRIFDEQLAA